MLRRPARDDEIFRVWSQWKTVVTPWPEERKRGNDVTQTLREWGHSTGAGVIEEGPQLPSFLAGASYCPDLVRGQRLREPT